MPEVGIFDSPEPNAFATGANRNNALVAVSTGLLQRMNEHEVDAVLGHEISHVANGDMVTLALIQGVLNTFVIFLARVLGTLIDRAISGNREGGGGFAYFGIVVVLPLALLSNLLTHLFVFRCGWTLHVSAGDYYYKKVRYRSKAAAQADIERQRELAAAIAPPAPIEPTRLPTRGGSLRRPW